VHVAADDRVLGADDLARRFETLLDAVGAEVALLRAAGLLVEVEGVVGAGLHAGLAADADVLVEVDDAVRPLVEGSDRADRHAGGGGALVATQHGEVAADGREGADFGVLHPGPEVAQRDFVLGLAGDRTGVAADAAALVENESVLHARSGRDRAP
jgi:hypothetical protein